MKITHARPCRRGLKPGIRITSDVGGSLWICWEEYSLIARCVGGFAECGQSYQRAEAIADDLVGKELNGWLPLAWRKALEAQP